tara:strand:- start:5 stop:703 length:699 start_codon:yes stop_codon:yes gene_type:complete
MSTIDPTYSDPSDTITADSLNGVFVALADATDGTTGRIDADNIRRGGVSSKHLAEAVAYGSLAFAEAGSVVSGSTRSSGVGGAATSYIDLLAVTFSSPVSAPSGAVLRFHFNQLIGNTATSGGGSTKSQQVYYLRVLLDYNDGAGALTLTLQPPVGYGLSNRSGNDASVAGSNGDNVSAWCRNSVSGLYINRTAGRNLVGVRLQLRWNVNDAGSPNTVDTCHCNGMAYVATF